MYITNSITLIIDEYLNIRTYICIYTMVYTYKVYILIYQSISVYMIDILKIYFLF